MFKRKDVIRSLYLIAIIVVIMVTLSQILVVHRQNHRGHRTLNKQSTNEMLVVLQKLERSIEAMMKKEYLPSSSYKEHLKALIYAEKISQLITKLNYDSKYSGENLKRIRSDNSYTIYRERKLRFLEVSSRNPTLKDKLNYESNERSISEEIVNKRNILGEAVLDNTFRNQAYKIHGNDKMYARRKQYTGIKADKRNSTKNCQNVTMNLDGKIYITPRIPDPLLDELMFSDIQTGGIWKPLTCIARQRTAIIIPYRDRKIHLYTLLHYLIPVLMRQLVEFRIFVIEQFGNLTFNKGRVMNTGFMEAIKLWTFDCVIFHDVDLLPENDKNMYTCGLWPRRMSISVDKFHYRLPYMTLVGGVFSIRLNQFLLVNGYSNLYWGWGAEDDDMALRLKLSNLKIERPPANIGRYKMIRHATRETSPIKMRSYLLKTVKKRYERDGLNTLDYILVFVNNTKLFTHVMVDIGQPPTEAEPISKLLH